ncbi:acyltransferase [Nonomuraea sp. KC401]|uniref:acyltransferase family protein n=1 Tax=unclassified Nonomuraea TaxID=2593643 RepID=UPI0010FD36B0|nr:MULTISPECIES: acyltransferase [unclassified Nonomuraea]NBE94369.1 acyltransferase family protein [Nonomuraea sp. K271]TLF73100.1 acyltransferase [Nonomuraea sp. KC401]
MGAIERAARELRRKAEQTPAHRDRHVDLLRAVAIAAVVTGHWLVLSVSYDGGLRGVNVLDVVPWTRPLTWLFQVMPIFFLVGGYANAASLAAHRRDGGGATGWTLRRTDRLVRPTTMLLAVLTAAGLAAGVAGVDPALVGMGVWLAGIPLWFLVAYLSAVVLTPVMHALHRRWGLAVPVVLVVLVAAGDVGRFVPWIPYAGAGSYLFAWLAVHQLGFAWQDGRLPARPAVALPLALGGLAALVGLTVFGPYPVSMVGVAGQQIQNTSPPTLALLALATAQAGVALLLHGPVNRWLQGVRQWTAVVAVNSVIMTLFLWHMTAAVLGVLALYPTGLLPQAAPGSLPWVLLRIPWLAALALILGLLVAVFGPVERRSGPNVPPERGAAALTFAGMAAVVGGLLAVALAGPGHHGPAGFPTAALIGYFAGAALLRITRSGFPGRSGPGP